jgi:hypothetical protein
MIDQKDQIVKLNFCGAAASGAGGTHGVQTISGSDQAPGREGDDF